MGSSDPVPSSVTSAPPAWHSYTPLSGSASATGGMMSATTIVRKATFCRPKESTTRNATW